MALFKSNSKITPCLWFHKDPERAADFYLSVFKGSKRGRTSFYGENAPLPKGTVLTIELTLLGQQFTILHGGPHPLAGFNDGISFMISCRDQKEVDYYWEKLSKGGEKVQCGWLKDKFGLSWQVVPDIIPKMLADKNEGRVNRVMQAILKMKKIDINKINAAYRGK